MIPSHPNEMQFKLTHIGLLSTYLCPRTEHLSQLLAGLPAYYGLYASLLAPCVYALFGTSIQLAVGPFALVSLLVVSTVRQVVDPAVVGLEAYIDAVMTTSLLIGLILVIFSFLRLGKYIVTLPSAKYMHVNPAHRTMSVCDISAK
jgi:MFS superfamily sulfate permease-like transporter